MTPPRRAGAAAAALLACSLAHNAAACELVLIEHRSGRELARLPLDPQRPMATLAFEHSVLGTTVSDTYAFRPHAVLVEERFDGAGYGLPHAAGAGEQLLHDAHGARLLLEREVRPLVVRPLPAQGMRLVLDGTPRPLAAWSATAIELTAQGCAAQRQ